MSSSHRIGAAARISGCSAESIRHYEKLQLLPAPARSDNGYRYYSQQDIQRLRFIRRGRELGLSLQTIRELLTMVDQMPHSDCEPVNRIARHHLEDIEQRIQALELLAGELRSVVHQCKGGEVRDCKIIGALSAGTNSPSV